MKFRQLDSFKRDVKKLPPEQRDIMKAGMRPFIQACNEAENEGHWPPRFRAESRVKDVKGAPGIWEMTWHFKRPDGRATFQWGKVDGATAVVWRRCGGHNIFKQP